MTSRTFFRGIFWTLIALALVFHVAGGWFFSSELIDDAFVPDPDSYVVTSGDYELEEIKYQSPLGEMDAWYLPAEGTTWVIHVHGLGATPAEAEPLFGPIQDAGYQQLSITYRNDESTPLDPSKYYQYGISEWEDISGAVDHALANGAENVILSCFSTGCAHTMSFMFNRSLDSVSGALMDSPNIDMGETVDYAATQRELPLIPVTVPPTLSAMAKFITSLRIGVNWKAIDYVNKADLIIKRPVLIHHGTEDLKVPISVSIELAEARPDAVRLISVEGAGHVDSYDVDLERYLEEVLRFLDRVG